MPLHLFSSSQFYFYYINQQSSYLSVNMTFNHLKKQNLQLFPNQKSVHQQPQWLFDNSRGFFLLFLTIFSFPFLYRNSTERRKFILQTVFQGKQWICVKVLSQIPSKEIENNGNLLLLFISSFNNLAVNYNNRRTDILRQKCAFRVGHNS